MTGEPNSFLEAQHFALSKGIGELLVGLAVFKPIILQARYQTPRAAGNKNLSQLGASQMTNTLKRMEFVQGKEADQKATQPKPIGLITQANLAAFAHT